MTSPIQRLSDVPRRLIVNADDFGRSPGINRGIITAHWHGIVTSTTLMVNLPWSSDAAALAERVPNLDIGLHLNFCYGPPVLTDVTSLLDAAGRLDRDLARLRQQATTADINREARAQLDRFRELLGRDPSHIDSHQHVHTWPVAVEPVAALAREISVPVRACSTQHRDRLRMLGVGCPDTFIIDFYGEANVDSGTLAAIVTALPPGTTELMCHPGGEDPDIADSSYRRERELELATLCSPDIRTLIEDLQIELTGFRTR
ncbi:MAG TPA: ChbG/HpnK family deacetylase [Thermomicrobiales bacterium]|nr:ChbG/HpnK family deacetylase [Thermomicrobiales bacterium]